MITVRGQTWFTIKFIARLVPPPPPPPRVRVSSPISYLFVTHLDPQPKSDAPFARFQGGVAKPFLELYERKASPEQVRRSDAQALDPHARHGAREPRQSCVRVLSLFFGRVRQSVQKSSYCGAPRCRLQSQQRGGRHGDVVPPRGLGCPSFSAASTPGDDGRNYLRSVASAYGTLLVTSPPALG